MDGWAAIRNQYPPDAVQLIEARPPGETQHRGEETMRMGISAGALVAVLVAVFVAVLAVLVLRRRR
jgi:hypothetical protein